MSIEGSISNDSRIRQFGLYRSIDSRTEEFLKLSRKRQIRQGCACAAVSTAVTVTVVVVVFFVYEFSFKSEMSIEDSLRKTWFSLVNDTSDEGFQANYFKSNIDKSKLTLFPILLKAIQKNDFLKQIFEEQSSSNPSYDSEETSEKWYQNPSSTLFSIFFKRSPVYYKSPKNIEYFKQVTKIRNYQRIIAYVDKMISERVYIGSSRPTNKEKFSESPIAKHTTQKTQSAKINLKKKDSNETKTETKYNNQGTNCTCNCPERYGSLMEKILNSFKHLLSLVITSKKKYSTECAKINKESNREQTDANLITLSETTNNFKPMEIRDNKKVTFIFESIGTTESYKHLFSFKGKSNIMNNQVNSRSTVRRLFEKPITYSQYYQNKLNEKPLSIKPLSFSLNDKQPIVPIDENEYDENYYKTETENDNYMIRRFDDKSNEKGNQIKNIQDQVNLQPYEETVSVSGINNTDFVTKIPPSPKSDTNMNFNTNMDGHFNVHPNTLLKIIANPIPIERVSEIKKVHQASVKKHFFGVTKTTTYKPNKVGEDAQVKQTPKVIAETKTPFPRLSTYYQFLLESSKQKSKKPVIGNTDNFSNMEDIQIKIKPITATSYKKTQKELKLVIATTEKRIHEHYIQKEYTSTTDQVLFGDETFSKLTPVLSTRDTFLLNKDEKESFMSAKVYLNKLMHNKNEPIRLLPNEQTAYTHFHEHQIRIQFETPLDNSPLINEDIQSNDNSIITPTSNILQNTKEDTKPIITFKEHLKNIVLTTDKPFLKYDQWNKQSKLTSTTGKPSPKIYKDINLEKIEIVQAQEGTIANVKQNQYILDEDNHDVENQEEPYVAEPITTIADKLLFKENKNIQNITQKNTEKPVLSTISTTVNNSTNLVEYHTKTILDGFQDEERLLKQKTEQTTSFDSEVAWKELKSEHIPILEALTSPNLQNNKESYPNSKYQLEEYDFNINNFFHVDVTE